MGNAPAGEIWRREVFFLGFFVYPELLPRTQRFADDLKAEAVFLTAV